VSVDTAKIVPSLPMLRRSEVS